MTISEAAVAAQRERDPALEPDIKNPILSIESLSLWYGQKRLLAHDQRGPREVAKRAMRFNINTMPTSTRAPVQAWLCQSL